MLTETGQGTMKNGESKRWEKIQTRKSDWQTLSNHWMLFYELPSWGTWGARPGFPRCELN